MSTPNPVTRTFSFNGADITVRARTGMDVIRVRMLFRQIVPDVSDPDYDFWVIVAPTFVDMVQRSTVKGSLGFTWPKAGDDAEKLRKAAKALLEQDSTLFLTWEEQLSEVNEIPNDPDLRPPDMLTEEQKKIPQSASDAQDSEHG